MDGKYNQIRRVRGFSSGNLAAVSGLKKSARRFVYSAFEAEIFSNLVNRKGADANENARVSSLARKLRFLRINRNCGIYGRKITLFDDGKKKDNSLEFKTSLF